MGGQDLELVCSFQGLCVVTDASVSVTRFSPVEALNVVPRAVEITLMRSVLRI